MWRGCRELCDRQVRKMEGNSRGRVGPVTDGLLKGLCVYQQGKGIWSYEVWNNSLRGLASKNKFYLWQGSVLGALGWLVLSSASSFYGKEEKTLIGIRSVVCSLVHPFPMRLNVPKWYSQLLFAQDTWKPKWYRKDHAEPGQRLFQSNISVGDTGLAKRGFPEVRL